MGGKCNYPLFFYNMCGGNELNVAEFSKGMSYYGNSNC
jgi:hypothetical protein